MLTVTYMKDNGSMIKLMVKVLIHMLMEPTITVIGLMINNMDLVWSLGQMVLNMKVIILMVKKRERESLHLLMAVITKESLNKMKYVDMANTIGPMVSNTMVNGVTIKCMEKEL
jgi:hypothetical protein